MSRILQNLALLLVVLGLGRSTALAQCNTSQSSVALDFSTQPVAEDWKAHTPLSVPAGSTLTQVSTSNYTVDANSSAGSTFVIGAVNAVNSLRWGNDYANNSPKTSSVTFNFTRPVSNFTVQVQDIDAVIDGNGSDFIDQVSFAGSNGGTGVIPVLSKNNPNAGFVRINGTTATGIVADGDNTTATDATVTAYFPDPITSLTLTYTNATASTDGSNQAVGIDLQSWCRLAPVANNITNPRLAPGQAQTAINSLTSTVDGTVGSYTLTTVPTPAQGILYVNGVVATAGQSLTPLQATQLSFAPAAGFTGTSFTYTVTDDAGVQSTPATYTLPVGYNLSGTIFEDVNYGGGAGRPLSTAGTAVRPGATVELYDAAGNFSASTVTNASGLYTFNAIPASNYTVRVVNSTVTSSRAGTSVLPLIPVQTYNGTTNRVGGEDPLKVDANRVGVGSAQVRFEGGLAGTDRTAYVDQVEVLDAGGNVVSGGILNGSFEAPNLGNAPAASQVNPANAAWAFSTTNAGIAATGNNTYLALAPPNGDQVAFIQTTPTAQGTMQQDLTLPPGTYTIRFQAGQRTDVLQTLRVLVNGVEVLASITPPASTTTPRYNSYTTAAFTVVAAPGSSLTSLTTATTTAQSVQAVSVTSSTPNIDFGYNFDTVVNTNDAGQGSLRQFILNSNALSNTGLAQVGLPADVETSIFMISNGSTTTVPPGLRSGVTGGAAANGVATIKTNTVLPTVTGANGTFTSIDGRTQSTLYGNQSQPVNEMTTGPEVVLDFNLLAGMTTQVANSTFIGLGLTNTTPNIGAPTAGISIAEGATGATVQDNTFFSNGAHFRINRTSGALVTGNIMRNALNPDADGIEMTLALNNTITNNQFLNNPGYGIDFISGASNGNTVSNNLFKNNGLNSTNGQTAGIGIRDVSAGNTFTGNTFTANVGDGISARAGSNNVFSQNSFFANGNLAIDLTTVANNSGDGVTLNDTGDTDAGTGATNGLINFPILVASRTVGGNLIVEGYARPGVRVELYVAAADATGFGEGQTYFYTFDEGSMLDTDGTAGAYSGIINGLNQGADNTNRFTVSIPLSSLTAAQQAAITANGAQLTSTSTLLTAVGGNRGTSEFSGLVAVNVADVTTTLAGPLNLNPGQPSGTYTATFTNNGPNQAANVTQQVTLPVGVTAVVVPTGATYDPATRVINFGTAATLVSGATNVFNFSFTAPTAPGSVALTSNVTTATNQGTDTAPNVATLNLTIGNPADVAATITAGASPLTAGQPGTFNVSFSNAGPATAAGVVASVQLPAGLGTVTATNGGVYDNATGLVTYAGLTSLANTGSTPSLITFTAPPTGPVTATASVSTTTYEAGRTANNTQAAAISVTPAYDVTTTISGPATTAVGVQTTFSVMTRNNGPSVAPSVAQTVQLPIGLTNVYVSNGGVYNAGSGLVTFPTLATLASGAGVDNTISFTPVAATGFTATATVVANANNTGDSNAGNNTATAAPTTVSAAPAAATNANIYTTITTPSNNVAPGATTTFTVTSGNRGAATATSVAQQTTLPAGLSNVVVTDANGMGVPNTATTGYNSATGVVIVPAVGSVLSGATTSYTISLMAPASGVIAAVATIAANNADSMPSDNVSTTDVTVNPTTDVTTTLTGPTSTLAGQSLTYTATTINNGAAPAINVAQTVAIPAGLPAGSVTVSGGGVYDSATGLVTFPAIASQAAGTSVSNTITYTAPANGPVVNVASVASATAETVAASNSSTVTTSVQRSSDVVVALNGPTALVAGNPATYTVTTTNNGPSPAASETTTVQLPAGLANVVVRDAAGNPIANAYNAATGLVTLATLTDQLPGAAGTVSNTITFTVPTGISELTASASAATTDATSDPTLTNNSATSIATIIAPTATSTDVQTTVTANVATQNAGAPVIFTVSTINNGPNAAANVVQRLTLSAGLTGVTASNGGIYDMSTGIVTFLTVPTQASGNTTPYTVTVSAPGAGPLTAVASVSSATSDTNIANNLATNSVAITPRTDVAVTLAGPVEVLVGQVSTYVVSVANNGPSLATSTTTVQLPSGLAGVTVSGGGTYDSGSGQVTFPAITNQVSGANGLITYTITAPVPAGSNLVATLTPTAGTNDQSVANNSVTLPVNAANLAPVANAVVNTKQTPEGNTAGPLSISALSATDANGNGTIVSYTVSAIPSAAQGMLLLNGVPVTENQVISAANIANLSFDPASSFVGNAFFSYTALDNKNVASTPAIYTIPVGQDLTSVYTATPVKGGTNVYQNGDVITNSFDVNGGAYNAATPQAVTDTGLRSATTDATGTNTLNGLGLTLDPTTGIITVTNRMLLRTGTYSANITTVDMYGGVTTQAVPFTIGSFPLPVELVAFTATGVKNVDASLVWRTATEQNNDHFEVERSLNGRDYAKIGQVQGQGSKSSPTDYALTDAGIGPKAAGTVYYRLKQVDTDGTATYSPVRTVAFPKSEAASLTPAIALYPNPATSATQLDLRQLPQGAYQISVLDGTGRVVLRATHEAGLRYGVELKSLASGTYTVLVQGQSLVLSKRLIKE